VQHQHQPQRHLLQPRQQVLHQPVRLRQQVPQLVRPRQQVLQHQPQHQRQERQRPQQQQQQQQQRQHATPIPTITYTQYIYGFTANYSLATLSFIITGEGGGGKVHYWLLDDVIVNHTNANANILTNGGFETGDLSGWTQYCNTTANCDTASSGNYAHTTTSSCYSGTYCVYDSCKNTDYLEQSFSTVPGDYYVISYYLNTGTTDAGPLQISKSATNPPALQIMTYRQYSDWSSDLPSTIHRGHSSIERIVSTDDGDHDRIDQNKTSFTWYWCFKCCIFGSLLAGIGLAIVLTFWLTSKTTATETLSM
ncbi:unnamed protein product, partial [Adineta steineri]